MNDISQKSLSLSLSLSNVTSLVVFSFGNKEALASFLFFEK